MNSATLIFFFIFLCIFIQFGNAQNECVDCSSVIDQNCVVNKSGMSYLAKVPRDKLLIAKLEPGEKPDPDLEGCINPAYKLLGDLTAFVCFWTPKLKCQAVGEKYYMKYLFVNNQRKVCSTCASYCGCDFSKGSSNSFINPHILFICILFILCS